MQNRHDRGASSQENEPGCSVGTFYVHFYNQPFFAFFLRLVEEGGPVSKKFDIVFENERPTLFASIRNDCDGCVRIVRLISETL